jgi:anti-sigma factor RsiW
MTFDEDGARESSIDCASARDLLPLMGTESIPAAHSRNVQAHLDTCGNCADEARFIQKLVGSREEPPSRLLPSIMAELERRDEFEPAIILPTGRRKLTWALPAAAAVVLALGIGNLWNNQPSTEQYSSLGFEPEVSMAWYGNDWMVAGQPVFEALPDDVLRSLIEELER